jgi:hypothetical protein
MNSNVRFSVPRPSWALACLCLALLGLLSLPSCKKEYFETDRIKDGTWNPEMAVPLIKSTITVQEVLDRFDDQDIIVVDTTGILALRYFDNIFSASMDSLIVFQDQQDQETYTITPAEAVALNSGNPVTVPTINYTFGFNTSNLSPQPDLQSIAFKSGNVLIDVTSQLPNNATIRIRIPGLEIAGVPFDQTMSNVSLTSNGQVNLSLTGAVLTFQPTNNIPVMLDISIAAGVGAAPGQSITVTSQLTGLAFSTVIGDFGQYAVPQDTGSVRIRFFENDPNNTGIVHWADPRIKAIFTNGVGAGVQVNVNQLDFFSPGSGTTPLTGTAPLLNNPTIGFNATVGGLHTDTFDVNRTNSNVVQVADTRPTRLFYGYSGTLNPGGGANQNWIQDTSKIRLDMEVFLPFDGTARDFRRSDTTEVDIFPLDDDIEEIERVTFRLTIDNGFPADAHAQVYFYDSTLSSTNPGVLIDSLFPNARAVVFASPPTPPYPGRIDQSNKERTVLDITLDRDKLNKLEAMGFRKLIARGWIDTYQLGSQNVQIYEDYTMDLYLGLMVKAKVNVQF